VVPDGITLSTREKMSLDAIIFGFGKWIQMSFRGLNGFTLNKYFESEGGAAGYYGSVFLCFPNALPGPNSASGLASLLFTIELHVHIPVLTAIAGKYCLEWSHAAHTSWIRKRIENTVFSSCFSYY
ncbi:hypothetical protein EV363DRAFT_1143864, partial [Boletus edulis]